MTERKREKERGKLEERTSGERLKGFEQVFEKRVRGIEMIGDFRIDGGEVPKIKRSAEHLMREHGVNPDERVTLVTKDGERELTLEKLSDLEGDLREELEKHGGRIRVGGEGPEGGPREELGRKAGRRLLNFAGKLATMAEENPERSKDYARPVAQCVRAAAPLLGVTFGAMGKAGVYVPPTPFKEGDIPWDWLDRTSKMTAAWFFDNIKFRSQYSIIGEYVSLPWALKTPYKKKKKKKKKLVSDLERLLDIFSIDIEDVFDLDKLAIQEIWSLEDLKKEHPTAKEYDAIKKLMGAEGYFEEREAMKAAEIAEKYEVGEEYERP